MSEQLRNEFIRAVRADPRLKTGEAMVALIIASYANLDGSKCFPSFEKIAKGAKMSPRNAKRHVQTLVYYGFLDFASGGGRTSNTYFLKVPETPDRFVGHPFGTTTDLVVSPMTPQDVVVSPMAPQEADDRSGVMPDDASGVTGGTTAVSPITPYKNRDQDSDKDKGGDERERSPRLTPGVAPLVVPRDRSAPPALRDSGIPSPPADLFDLASGWTEEEDGHTLEYARLNIEMSLERSPWITQEEAFRLLPGICKKALIDLGIPEEIGLEL